VLIDCGCRVTGYESDITRTIWFGDSPSDEFKKVFNLVHDAQTAAIELGRPLYTPCQEMDRAARKVISDGGYGPSFTHRLGHGLAWMATKCRTWWRATTHASSGDGVHDRAGDLPVGHFGVRIEDDAS